MPQRLLTERARFAAILFLAAALRLWGAGFGLYHADEPIVVNHALAYGTGDLNPHFFAIPPLVSYLAFAVYGSFFAAGKLLGQFPGVEAFQALFVRDPQVFYVLGRIALGVVPGTLTVWLAYAVTRRWFSERAALLAAFFLAVNFLHARDSHYLYTDALLALACLAAASAALETLENPSTRRWLIAGIWIGIAAAVKYNGAIAAVPVAAAFLVDRRPIRLLLLAAGASIAAFLVLNPFPVVDAGAFWYAFSHQVEAEGPVFWHHLRVSLPGAAGAGVLLLAACGAARAWSRDRRVAGTLFSFPAAYLISLNVYGQHHERYVIPVLAFVAIAAGIGSDALLFYARTRAVRIAVIAAIVLSAAIPAAKLVQANLLFSIPDTTAEAGKWIEANAPAGSRVAFDHSFYRPDLRREDAQWDEIAASTADPRAALKNRLQKIHADPSRRAYFLYFLSDTTDPPTSSTRPVLSFDVEGLKRTGVGFVILHYGVTPEHEAFTERVKSEGKLLARFSPYRDGAKLRSDDKFSLTCAAFSWKELFSRERFGPVYEVWAL